MRGWRHGQRHDLGTGPLSAPPSRLLPELDDDNRGFWTLGAGGRLHLRRCRQCGYWLHPPSPVCPLCLGAVDWEPVSGRATVASATLNVHPWRPDLSEPYVIAVVELPEQEALRLTTNVVGCPVESVVIGMQVDVRFEQHGEVYVPVFVPAGNGPEPVEQQPARDEP